MTEREIFDAVLDLPDAADRAAYLERACGTDAELRRRVESLLGSHDVAGSFLGTPAVAAPDHANTRTFSSDEDTDDETHDPRDEVPLTFLTHSKRPDSLGRIGHYEVLQILGKGGFGIVFRAFDEHLHRVVAVKVLAPRMAATSPARKRFLREARSSAQLQHENVVQVFEVAEQTLPYLVMEYVPGETLQQKLDQNGPLDIAEILRIGRQAAEGLAAAHAKDLIHRDVKPANILLESGPRGRVKLTDFGMARTADDASVSQSGIVAGTPMYMAPEQAKGEHIDFRADLFSLGSVLYVMCTGRPPFRANATVAVLKRVADDNPRPIREIIPETPRWLCDIIAKLHAKNPAERFQSAREVADVLADCETRYKSNARTADFPSISAEAGSKSARWKWIAAFGIILCCAVGVTAYLLSTPERSTTDTKPSFAATNPINHDRDRDRDAAVFTISIGGQVRVNDKDELIGTLEELPKQPFTLTGVHCRDNAKVTDEGLRFFQGCRHIKHLDLTATKVTDAGLANFKDSKQLRVLDLFATTIGDAGLAHFQGCPITDLSLRSTNVTDAIGEYFGHCTDLAMLGLGHTKVTPAGLARFQNCTKLKHLDLDVLPVGDADVAPFVNRKNLEVLHLGGTQVTDEVFLPLKDCKQLNLLLLSGTSISAGCVDQLKTALPKCRIFWSGGAIEPAKEPIADAEVKRISALTTDVQLEEVRKLLKQRNPNFDGTLNPTTENNIITRLEFSTLEVNDLAPVRALPGLKELVCSGADRMGKLTDLSPLQGLQLTHLDCNNNGQLADLSPLKGIPLKVLHVQHTIVQDLKPVTKMKLEHLNASHTAIADLSPLKGMPLVTLYLDNTKVADLTALRDMPLRALNVRNLALTAERDGPTLRTLLQLEEINSESPDEFVKSLPAK